jgi:hypothetical protein
VSGPTLTRVNYVSDLTPDEKDRLLTLILDRLGVEIMAYKFDGDSERIIELRKQERS